MHYKALRIVTLLSFIILLTLPMAASAEEHHGQAFVGNRAVVVHSNPYWGWGGWGDPFWGGYYSPYYYPIDNRGKIKIKDSNKFDQVYLNGAYAGTVDKMKNIRLDPGRYSVQIRNGGKQLVDRQVYVVTGKTVEIRVSPDMQE